jgi:hypothetical protein
MGFKETLMKVLKHELGHWLVARHLGFAVGDIEILVWKLDEKKGGANQYVQDGSSRVIPEPILKSLDELSDYLDKRIQVLYAGVAAQIHGQRLTEKEVGKIIELDAPGDQKTIEELAILVRGFIRDINTDPVILDEKTNEFITASWEKSQASVAELYPKIERMAAQMARMYKSGSRNVFELEDLEKIENMGCTT